MSTAAVAIRSVVAPPVEETETVTTTLLDLVAAVADVANDENEVVATVMHLLGSGRVRLVGNFLRADVAES